MKSYLIALVAVILYVVVCKVVESFLNFEINDFTKGWAGATLFIYTLSYAKNFKRWNR